LKRRGGVPSGAAQIIAIAGLALPKKTGVVQFFIGILCNISFNVLAGYGIFMLRPRLYGTPIER